MTGLTVYYFNKLTNFAKKKKTINKKERKKKDSQNRK